MTRTATPSSVPAFQFHKGTIKTPNSADYLLSFVEFQFHKGTIKTAYLAKCLLLTSIFQFHKGTIKTRRCTTSLTGTVISIP